MAAAVLRVVLDSNVLFSGAAFSQGNPRRILDLVAENRLCLIVNSYIVEEVVDHLIKKRKEDSVRWFFLFLSEGCVELVEKPSMGQIQENLHIVPADSKDVPVILTAINSNADYLVSGDQHIIAHDEQTTLIDERVNVLTPAQLIGMFPEQKSPA